MTRRRAYRLSQTQGAPDLRHPPYVKRSFEIHKVRVRHRLKVRSCRCSKGRGAGENA